MLFRSSLADRDNVVSVGASSAWTSQNDGSAHEAIERQIINVAAGTEDTDAVNVAQLKDATGGSVKNYFSADGEADGSDDADASGEGSVAAGASSAATGTDSVAMGHASAAFGDGSTAVGADSGAFGTGSSAFGTLSTASSDYATAIGYGSASNGESSLAIGSYAQMPDSTGHELVDMVTSADGYAAVAIGPGANAATDYSIAAGAGATASGGQGLAFGLQARALGDASMALGGYSKGREIGRASCRERV